MWIGNFRLDGIDWRGAAVVPFILPVSPQNLYNIRDFPPATK